MNTENIVFAVKHKDEEIRALSRSGGVFTALSDFVLDNGGVVYGCALNEKFLAEHRRAAKKEERDAFRGSKYIQSEINNCYNLCAEDLKSGLRVLFSGTPCQIDALNNFLFLKNVNTANLITVDILCHGVPSPMVWKDYLNEQFADMKIESVDFRDKKTFGWRDHAETITVNGEKKHGKCFTHLFYSHYILRPACFNCHYKKENRVSDITIGDYWKIENNDISFDDDKGISFVKLNTRKGESYFKSVEKELEIREFPIATSIQPAIDHNYVAPSNREDFWREYGLIPLKELTEKYTAIPKLRFIQRAKGVCLKIIKRIIRIIL